MVGTRVCRVCASPLRRNGFVACRRHWLALPGELRTRMLNNYGAGLDELFQANLEEADQIWQTLEPDTPHNQGSTT